MGKRIVLQYGTRHRDIVGAVKGADALAIFSSGELVSVVAPDPDGIHVWGDHVETEGRLPQGKREVWIKEGTVVLSCLWAYRSPEGKKFVVQLGKEKLPAYGGYFAFMRVGQTLSELGDPVSVGIWSADGDEDEQVDIFLNGYDLIENPRPLKLATIYGEGDPRVIKKVIREGWLLNHVERARIDTEESYGVSPSLKLGHTRGEGGWLWMITKWNENGETVLAQTRDIEEAIEKYRFYSMILNGETPNVQFYGNWSYDYGVRIDRQIYVCLDTEKGKRVVNLTADRMEDELLFLSIRFTQEKIEKVKEIATALIANAPEGATR